jgi:hypothetical protein
MGTRNSTGSGAKIYPRVRVQVSNSTKKHEKNSKPERKIKKPERNPKKSERNKFTKPDVHPKPNGFRC